MSSCDEFASVIAEFGRGMGVADLRLDGEGLAALTFDGGITLHLGHEAPTDLAVLYVELPPPSGQDRAELHARLLEANLTATETGGASLALDPRTGRPFLVRRLPPRGLALPELEAAARAILDAAEAWGDRLAGGGAPEPEFGAAATLAAGMPMGLRA